MIHRQSLLKTQTCIIFPSYLSSCQVTWVWTAPNVIPSDKDVVSIQLRPVEELLILIVSILLLGKNSNSFLLPSAMPSSLYKQMSYLSFIIMTRWVLYSINQCLRRTTMQWALQMTWLWLDEGIICNLVYVNIIII